MTVFGYVDHHRVTVPVLRHIRHDWTERRYRKRSWRHSTEDTWRHAHAGEGGVDQVRHGFVPGPLRRGRSAEHETGRRIGDYGLHQLFGGNGQRFGLKVVVVVVRDVGSDSRRKFLRPRLGERLSTRRRATRGTVRGRAIYPNDPSRIEARRAKADGWCWLECIAVRIVPKGRHVEAGVEEPSA